MKKKNFIVAIMLILLSFGTACTQGENKDEKVTDKPIDESSNGIEDVDNDVEDTYESTLEFEVVSDIDTSEQMNIIEEYFEAINAKDTDAIYDLGYVDEVREKKHCGYDVIHFFCEPNSSYMCFKRGLYTGSGYYPCTMDSYPNTKQGLSIEEVQELTMDMLEVSYEVINIKHFDEIKLIERKPNSEEEVLKWEDIERKVSYKDFKTGEEISINIDDLFVAQLYIEWKYDDMLFGMDEAWWENEEFLVSVENTTYATYEQAIQTMETYDGKEKVYTLLLYRYDDGWYIVQPEYLSYWQGPYFEGEAYIGCR